MRGTLVILPYLGFVSLGLPDGLFGVAWPDMQGTFGLPIEALGGLLASFWLGYTVSSVGSGILMRALGVGLLLSASTAATAASLLAIGLAPAWWPVLVGGFLSGAGGGAIDAGLNSYAAAHYSRRRLMWLHACFGIGTAVGPLLMTSLLHSELSWRWGFVIAGGFQAGLAGLFARTREEWKVAASPSEAPVGRQDRPNGRDLMLRLRVWLGIGAFFVSAGVEVTAGQWAHSLLTLARGMSEGAAGIMVALYWSALTLGGIAFGIVADRVQPDQLLRGCLGMLVGGGGLVWAAPGALATGVGIVLTGLALAPVFPTLIASTADRVGEARVGQVIGFQIAAAALGGATLPALAGILGARFGLDVIGPCLFLGTVALLGLSEAMRGCRRRSAIGIGGV